MATYFFNEQDPQQIIIRQKIEEWLLLVGLKRGNDKINIQETLHCAEPNCPQHQTQISVVDDQGQKRVWKIAKPLNLIRKLDVMLLKEH